MFRSTMTTVQRKKLPSSEFRKQIVLALLQSVGVSLSIAPVIRSNLNIHLPVKVVRSQTFITANMQEPSCRSRRGACVRVAVTISRGSQHAELMSSACPATSFSVCSASPTITSLCCLQASKEKLRTRKNWFWLTTKSNSIWVCAVAATCYCLPFQYLYFRSVIYLFLNETVVLLKMLSFVLGGPFGNEQCFLVMVTMFWLNFYRTSAKQIVFRRERFSYFIC